MVLAVALAWPLRSPRIEHHGEAREGLGVQAIVHRGTWILPRRNGELPTKPPLFHWFGAIAAKVWGLSDVTVRLPSAVAAWLVAALTFALARATGGRRTGWMAVGVLLGMVPFLESAVEARVDMLLAACTTAALAAFFLWYRSKSANARALVYGAIAAGVLAKGPIGAALPVLVMVIFLAVEGDLLRLRDLWSWPLIALLTLVDVGWYALATIAGGRNLLVVHFVRENWSRFVGSIDYPRAGRGHTLRMPVLLFTQYLPWTLVLAWSAAPRRHGARADVVDRFLHVWWIVVLGVFTIAAGKRPVYLLPAAPAMALLVGRALAAMASRPTDDSPGMRHAWRASAGRVAVALVLFDVGALVTLQLTRESRVRRPGLSAFAAEVERLVPGNDAVAASPAMGFHDRMVLAYRLQRPVERRADVAPGVPYLVPAAARLGEWCRDASLLAESGGTPADFALMRANDRRRRAVAPCAEDPKPAGNGGPADPHPQEHAGSRPDLLLPFGDAYASPGPRRRAVSSPRSAGSRRTRRAR